MSKIINFIKDMISPKNCYSCKKEGHFLCLKCLSKMKNFREFCFVCKQKNYEFNVHENCKKNVYYDKIIILTHYKNFIIKKLIKDSKYYAKKDILEDFGEYLSIILLKNEEIINNKKFIIMPSPMYFMRKLIRGYNHSEILSKIVSRSTGIDLNLNLIKKIKHTKQQSKLTKKERENNLIGVFKLNEDLLDYIRGKNIIIVDDVVSTGSTINELSKILKYNGVNKVIGLVIAND